ncbi:MAG: energy transducer TonB [Rhodocyclaceae bacterium]|nr:energy transducer TonB [Rhodocyclaceae bacterium]
MGLFFPDYGTPLGKPRGQTLSFAGVAAGHAALLVLVALAVPAERFADLARPFTARLIESAPEVPPPPPPRQTPRKARPAPQPVLAADTPAPQAAAFAVPPQPPAPQAAPAPAPIAAPEAVPVTAARFDADYLDNPKPVYPHASRRLREEGRVLLRVRVSAAGLAEKVEIKLSSGFARLDQAAEEAVSRWRFVPARRGDETVAAWVQVPITFNLQG